MRNLTPASITQAFADYAKNAPSERTRTLLVGLAGHLHSFVRENKVTQAEWGAAIDALTRAKQVHRRQAQRIHPVLRPAGRVLAGRHGERGDRRHAILGAGPVPYRRRPRAGQRRRSVARPGRRAAGGERQDNRREGRAGQGRGAGAVAERRQRALLAAGSRRVADQLSCAPDRGAPTAASPSRPCGRSPTPCPTTARPATCCARWAARPGGRRICT